MCPNGSVSSATFPDWIKSRNAAAPSTLIIVPAAASNGPSGSCASSTTAPCFSRTAIAPCVAVSISGSSFFHAFVSHPIFNFCGAGPPYSNAASSPGRELRSFASCPASTERINPQSSAVRAIGPILSSEYARAIAPYRLTLPNVGRKPEIPQNPEGQMIEPHVSVPIANAAIAAETIAPDPLDEPQVQQPSFHGFLAGPVSDAEAKR